MILGACERGETADLAESPGVVHVHGLGVDPGDQTLYAATHNGLFAVPDEGPARRLGGRYQDTMGFTVVGPRHFLASGHPDMQDDDLFERGTPPHLGLIESRDRGESWERRSLFGEADLHAIDAAHGLVYAYDATGARFLVTRDKRSWETRSGGILLSGFAVSPTDPETVIAATDTGVVLSVDGGRSFTPVSAAPPLAILAWRSGRGLWGVTADGKVFNATSPDGDWSPRGALRGDVEAFLVTDQELFAAAAPEGASSAIYRSSDDGATWRLRYHDPAASPNVKP